MENAIEKVNSFDKWYHQIELMPGVTTPGSHDSKQELELLNQIGLPLDCNGLRVLDIGCRDGFFSFEMERRGADVVALDYAAPEVLGFSVAAELLNSSLEYSVANVYDLNSDDFGEFDIVLFLGVLYHLRNPLLALDKIRSVAKPGAFLFVETQLATDIKLNKLDIPLCQFFPSDTLYGDGTNAWGPNEACLNLMLEEAQFDVTDSRVYGHRGYAIARAIEDNKLESFRKMDTSTLAFSKRQKNG